MKIKREKKLANYNLCHAVNNISFKTLIFLVLSGLFFHGCGSKTENGDTPTDGSTSGSGVITEGDDPLYSSQWHLNNTGQNGGVIGIDLNVDSVHNSGNKGDNIIISILDDGVEKNHEDLWPNKAGDQFHYDYVDKDSNPESGYHGTSVTGIIAARDNNSLGVRGVAPRALFAGLNFLQVSTLINMEDALTRNSSSISVSNNSWGFEDNTGQFFQREATWKTAIDTGLISGRGGKGIVFVWAAGNGGSSSVDNSNYDGYANYYGVIAVCAVGNQGTQASYSEQGANLWVCGPSMGNNNVGITTADRTGESAGLNISTTPTDLTDKNYTKVFNGTSAAAPMVSGVAALVLSANSNLGWRDVKIILAQTATKVDTTDSDWTTNGATTPTDGYNISHKYGFGLVNAQEAVSKAQTWTNVGTLVTETYPTSGSSVVNTAITDNSSTPISDTISVSGSSIGKIEYVTVTVNTSHPDWGELDIVLRRTSAYSTQSQLSLKHNCIVSGSTSNCSVTNNTWTFGISRHLGESPNGDWTLDVKDLSAGQTGSFVSWSITIYGEAL